MRQAKIFWMKQRYKSLSFHGNINVLVGEATETQADAKVGKEQKSEFHTITYEHTWSLKVQTNRMIGNRNMKGQSC